MTMIATTTTGTIEISSALAEQGLRLRNWRDVSDYSRMSQVLIGSRNADGLEEARTGADLQEFYGRMKDLDPTRNILLMEEDGTLVGYSACRWWEETNANFVHKHWVFVLPEWRGRGIEQELLLQSENRMRVVAEKHPHNATNLFQGIASDSQLWLSRALQDGSYEPVRYFYDMVCENLENLPEAELPPGIETRPAKPEHYHQIWLALIESFREHWGEPVDEESNYDRFIQNPLLNPGMWQVAWDGDQVVGTVLNFVDAKENEKYNYKRGYTEDISVRKPWRERGIAKGLLVKSMRMFRDMGFDHTALGVDTENATGALKLYQGVGYKTLRKFTVYRKAF